MCKYAMYLLYLLSKFGEVGWDFPLLGSEQGSCFYKQVFTAHLPVCKLCRLVFEGICLMVVTVHKYCEKCGRTHEMLLCNNFSILSLTILFFHIFFILKFSCTHSWLELLTPFFVVLNCMSITNSLCFGIHSSFGITLTLP